MFVNNEIGVKQPIADIGKMCRERKVFLHTDAAQAVGKVPVNVNDMNIDLLSISGHKLYGPKGVCVFVMVITYLVKFSLSSRFNRNVIRHNSSPIGRNSHL